jgi:hypothetical protein
MVWNDGPRTLEAWVTVTVRDEIGRVIRCGATQTDTPILGPGQSSTFLVVSIMPPPIAPISYVVNAFGLTPD